MDCPVNVHLLCGNSIVREGLSRILSDREFIVYHYSNFTTALATMDERHQALEPSLLLIDSGIEDLDDNKLSTLMNVFSCAYLVFLSDRFDFQLMLKAFKQGAMAYIIKEIACDRLAATLRLVAMGARVLPPQLADELQSRPTLGDLPDIECPVDAASLSQRELEVLHLLMVGCPNKVISKRMDISDSTVKVHVKAVLRKLHVENRTQAAIWAANHGMLSVETDVDRN